MLTTPQGIPYPEPGDHTRTWEYWQAQAEAIDPKLATVTDITTGFVIAAGFSLTSAQARLHTIGPVRLVAFRCEVARTGAALTSSVSTGNIADTPVVTIPAAVRPGQRHWLHWTSAAGPAGSGYIDLTGALAINDMYPGVTLATGAALLVSSMWALG